MPANADTPLPAMPCHGSCSTRLNSIQPRPNSTHFLVPCLYPPLWALDRSNPLASVQWEVSSKTTMRTSRPPPPPLMLLLLLLLRLRRPLPESRQMAQLRLVVRARSAGPTLTGGCVAWERGRCSGPSPSPFPSLSPWAVHWHSVEHSRSHSHSPVPEHSDWVEDCHSLQAVSSVPRTVNPTPAPRTSSQPHPGPAPTSSTRSCAESRENRDTCPPETSGAECPGWGIRL